MFQSVHSERIPSRFCSKKSHKIGWTLSKRNATTERHLSDKAYVFWCNWWLNQTIECSVENWRPLMDWARGRRPPRHYLDISHVCVTNVFVTVVPTLCVCVCSRELSGKLSTISIDFPYSISCCCCCCCPFHPSLAPQTPQTPQMQSDSSRSASYTTPPRP